MRKAVLVLQVPDDMDETDLTILLLDALVSFRQSRGDGNAEKYLQQDPVYGKMDLSNSFVRLEYNCKLAEVQKRLKWASDLAGVIFHTKPEWQTQDPDHWCESCTGIPGCKFNQEK